MRMEFRKKKIDAKVVRDLIQVNRCAKEFSFTRSSRNTKILHVQQKEKTRVKAAEFGVVPVMRNFLFRQWPVNRMREIPGR